MKRVILDTNVLISAFFWNGNELELINDDIDCIGHTPRPSENQRFSWPMLINDYIVPLSINCLK